MKTTACGHRGPCGNVHYGPFATGPMVGTGRCCSLRSALTAGVRERSSFAMASASTLNAQYINSILPYCERAVHRCEANYLRLLNYSGGNVSKRSIEEPITMKQFPIHDIKIFQFKKIIPFILVWNTNSTDCPGFGSILVAHLK